MGSYERLCLSLRVCICACMEYVYCILYAFARAGRHYVAARFKSRLALLERRTICPDCLAHSPTCYRKVACAHLCIKATRGRLLGSGDRPAVRGLRVPHRPWVSPAPRGKITLVSVLCPYCRSGGADRFHIRLVCSRLGSTNAVLSEFKGSLSLNTVGGSDQ